jgi:hypothetical protein
MNPKPGCIGRFGKKTERVRKFWNKTSILRYYSKSSTWRILESDNVNLK